MARRALGPATLRAVQAVRATVRADAPALVACSGGADSLALASAAMTALGPDGRCSAVVVDHGLQPGSAHRADEAVAALNGLGYADVRVEPVQVRSDGQGPEAAAREARYAALDRLAAELADEGDAQVLLGHTMDDQAETVLLGLLRGSGTRSLAGMAVRSGRYRRPFLGLRRADTEAVCAELGLRPWLDPHNDDDRFTRSRLRRRVLPVLTEQLGPAVVEGLARTADLARADADLLDTLAAGLHVAASDGADLGCPPLAEADEALRTRVIRSWLRERGASDLGVTHVRAVEALITDWRGQGPIDVPGLRVVRRGGRLCVVESVA